MGSVSRSVSQVAREKGVIDTIQPINFMPYAPDPVQEAIGISSGVFIAIVIAVLVGVITLVLVWRSAGESAFTEEQEKRIKELAYAEAKNWVLSHENDRHDKPTK